MPTSVEHIRLAWKPRYVRVLFVGEAPPVSGEFFYKWRRPDSIHHYTQRAFADVFESVPEDPRKFLSYFRRAGCYFEDLCHTPIRTRSARRKDLRREHGIALLTERIKRHHPLAVIAVMKEIALHVRVASCFARVDPDQVYTLPYPGQSHQLEYVRQLRAVLRRLHDLDMLA
ncbi:MAG: hypothetical protein Kow0074_12660 [Candidatus Zixiibacteriota bacterium]